MWESNARMVEEIYTGYVNWKERFYICPECGESVYECDWDEDDLCDAYCPICGFAEEKGDEDDF